MNNQPDENKGSVGIGKSPSVMTVDAVHELSNLLTVVVGSLEQLQRHPSDDKGRQQLERAKKAAQRGCELLRSMIEAKAGRG